MSASSQYPCGTCQKDVGKNEKALQCEGACGKWFHCSCIFKHELSTTQYQKVAASPDAWVCANCCGDQTLPHFQTTSAIDVFHFDFQKNLPTPKLTVGKQFYLRLLWTYLFGIYCVSNDTLCAFMWSELIAHRGANEVVSSLAHFIFNMKQGRTGAKWSIWWADNCPGQNKNHCVIWFFLDLIRRGIYARIDYKFLVVGHTYGPADRSFGVIEKHTKKIENIYTPQEWCEHVQNSTVSGKIQVTEMSQDYFFDYWEFLKNMYIERNVDIEGNQIQFSKILWFNFGVGEELIDGQIHQTQHPLEVWVRYSHNISEKPQKILYQKKSCIRLNLTHQPDPLYDSYPLPIKYAKACDVQKLAREYVPENARSIYMNLRTLEDDNDDLSDSV